MKIAIDTQSGSKHIIVETDSIDSVINDIRTGKIDYKPLIEYGSWLNPEKGNTTITECKFIIDYYNWYNDCDLTITIYDFYCE